MTHKISYLADHVEYLDELAEWLHAEWGWFTAGSTLELRREELRQHTNRDALPLAIVAHEAGVPLGTAALREVDMDTRPQLTPWLASVYVTPSAREGGLGTRLVARIEAEAERLGFDHLYLVTFDKADFYAKRGWHAMERTLYRGESVVVMCKSLGAPRGNSAHAFRDAT